MNKRKKTNPLWKITPENNGATEPILFKGSSPNLNTNVVRGNNAPVIVGGEKTSAVTGDNTQKKEAESATLPTSPELDTRPVRSDPIIVTPDNTTPPDVEAETVSPSADAETSEPTAPEYQKYLDLQKEYINKYLGRDDFNYDVNADELYEIYRKQALDTAEKARRDTVAQAAGLTGGYGSSYATTAGAQAYNEIASSADAMIPELYEAALAKYNAEGDALLEKADLAGAQAEALADGAMPVDDILALLGGTSEDGSDGEDFASAQAVRTAQAVNDSDGSNDTGATIYDEAMRIYTADESERLGWSDTQIKQDLMTWKKSDGTLLTEAEVNYLLGEINNAKLVRYYSGLQDANGVSLETYLENLQQQDLSGEQVYELLSNWTDASGAKLTDEDIFYLMAYI